MKRDDSCLFNSQLHALFYSCKLWLTWSQWIIEIHSVTYYTIELCFRLRIRQTRSADFTFVSPLYVRRLFDVFSPSVGLQYPRTNRVCVCHSFIALSCRLLTQISESQCDNRRRQDKAILSSFFGCSLHAKWNNQDLSVIQGLSLEEGHILRL